MASFVQNNDNDIVANNNNDIVANSNNDIVANNDNDIIDNNSISAEDNAIITNNDHDIFVNNDNDFMENNSNNELDIEADDDIEEFQEETTQNASVHNIVLSNIANSNTPDDNLNRKLYVGGLSMETTEFELGNYFSVYGNIESITLKPCRNAEKKNGFAFIVFETAEAVNITKAVSNHALNGESITVQTSKLRHSKIFINLPNELEEEDVKAYFSEFGNIIFLDVPRNKKTKERKGYCVITYDSIEVVDEIVRTPIHTIKGIEVSIQKSPFIDSKVKKQPNVKKFNRKQKSDSFNNAGGVKSGGKRKAKQDKHFRNRTNMIRQNFNANSFINPNGERSNFVEQTFGGQPNLANTQNFSGRQNFNGKRNFRGRHNFDGFESRPNFDGGYNFNGQQNFCTELTYNNQQGRQQIYENRRNFGTDQMSGNGSFSNTEQNLVEQHSYVGQNRNARQNFGINRAFSPSSQTNSNSMANNINPNAQNLGSRGTSNLRYGNNQVDNGNNSYQQGYWSNCTTTNSGNAGNTFSGPNSNFRQRHTLKIQNNASNAVSRNLQNTYSVENQGYNNNYRGNEFFHNSAFVNNNNRNNNNNNRRENINEGFGFALGREGNMRSMNQNGRGAAWEGFNANINPNNNNNRRYQPY